MTVSNPSVTRRWRRASSFSSKGVESERASTCETTDAWNQFRRIVTSVQIHGDLTDKQLIAIIDKLKSLVYDGTLKSSFTEKNLEIAGITTAEVEFLDGFISDAVNEQRGCRQVSFTSRQVQDMISVLAVMELRNDGFCCVLSSQVHEAEYQSLRLLICETLCSSEALTEVEKFSNTDMQALEEKRKLLFQSLRERFVTSEGKDLLSLIHAICSCAEYIETIVPDEITKLDFSWTNVRVADVIALCSVIKHSSLLREMVLRECSLTSRAIRALASRLQGSKLEIHELDVTWNRDISAKGLGYLGEIVKDHAVSVLRMSDCGLKYEDVQSFLERSGNTRISELDVSSNEDLGVDGVGCIGEIVKKHKVEKLVMSNCRLTYESLQSFNTSSADSIILELNISGNDGLGTSGIVCVSEILKDHSVERLSMANCGLEAEGFELFSENLENMQVKEMDFSDQSGLNPDYKFPLDAVCKILPKASKLINMCSNELTTEQLSSLQNSLNLLHPTKLRVLVHEDLCLVSRPCTPPEDSGDRIFKLPVKEATSASVRTESYYCFYRMSESSTKEIGSEGDSIEVGGCSVMFPPNAFQKLHKVTITAEIGSDRMPPSTEGEVITPILCIETDADELKEEATVKLATWCCADDTNDSPLVRLLHFSRKSNKWEVFDEYKIGNSNFIEFKRKSFCRIVAVISWLYSLFYYNIESSVYADGQIFVVAFHVRNKLCTSRLRQKLRKMGGNFELVSTSDIICKRTDEIECKIYCESPSGYLFFPPDPFSWDWDMLKSGNNVFVKRCILMSELGEAGAKPRGDFTIGFRVNKEGKNVINDGFWYVCNKQCTTSHTNPISSSNIYQTLAHESSLLSTRSQSTLIWPTFSVANQRFRSTHSNSLFAAAMQPSVGASFRLASPINVISSNARLEIHHHHAPTVAGSISYGEQRVSSSHNSTEVSASFAPQSRRNEYPDVD